MQVYLSFGTNTLSLEKLFINTTDMIFFIQLYRRVYSNLLQGLKELLVTTVHLKDDAVPGIQKARTVPFRNRKLAENALD